MDPMLGCQRGARHDPTCGLALPAAITVSYRAPVATASCCQPRDCERMRFQPD